MRDETVKLRDTPWLNRYSVFGIRWIRPISDYRLSNTNYWLPITD